MRLILLACLALMGSTIAGTSWACGPQSDCPVGERHYRIYTPKQQAAGGEIGALVFAHGYRGTAAGTMKNKSLLRLADELGVALIATKSKGADWELPFSPFDYESDGLAEEAYYERVLQDAAERFQINRDNVVMSGFSAGGMMTWHLACKRPDLFAGFAPMAGTFWLQPPEECQLPVRGLVHIHGAQDPVVPLEGRQIRATHQGKVRDSLALYTELGGFTKPQQFVANDLSCEKRANAEQAPLVFCTFEGGHSFSTKHLRFALSQLLGG